MNLILAQIFLFSNIEQLIIKKLLILNFLDDSNPWDTRIIVFVWELLSFIFLLE